MSTTTSCTSRAPEVLAEWLRRNGFQEVSESQRLPEGLSFKWLPHNPDGVLRISFMTTEYRAVVTVDEEGRLARMDLLKP